MSTLLYSPGVKVFIETEKNGTIEVSDDLVDGTMVRRSDGVSSFNFSLQNARRKYDGAFAPNDRIVVMMRRITWMRVFTGYLNSVPLLTAWPRVVPLAASCSLKRLQYWYWDAGLPASQTMVAKALQAVKTAEDGGIANAILTILKEVVGWPPEKIHIAGIPDDWFDFAYRIAQDIDARAEEADEIAQQFYSALQGAGSIGGGGIPSGGDTVWSGTMKPGNYGGETINKKMCPYVEKIYNNGKHMGATNRDLIIAMMTAMQESTMGDDDKAMKEPNQYGCIGLFQQTIKGFRPGWGPNEGYGTKAQLLDPDFQCKNFFSRLLKVKNRESMTLAQAAEKIQVSGEGWRFAKHEAMGRAVVTFLNNASKKKSGGGGAPSQGTDPNWQGGSGSWGQGRSTGQALADIGVKLVTNYPNIRYQLGGDDPPSTPPNKVRKLDCCLTGDAMVSTVRGPIPIAEIKPGDRVYAWQDGSMVVRDVIGRLDRPVQDVLKVRTRNRTVRASANHPFLRVERPPERPQDASGRFSPVEWTPQWARADALRRGDLIVVLDHLDDIGGKSARLADGTAVDADVAWLLGLIVADGHVTAQGVSICVYGEERERAEKIVESRWGSRGSRGDQWGVSFGSVRLRDALLALGMKRPGPDKRVPEIVFEMTFPLVQAFLQGYWEGDGSEAGNGRVYHSASRRLIDEVRMLHIAMGDSVTNISTDHRKHPITIKGKAVKYARPLHTFVAYENAHKDGQRLRALGAYRVVPDDRFRIERILAVDKDGTEPTFDIEVDGAQNFIANGVVVHNSSFVQWCVYQLLGSLKGLPRTTWSQIQYLKSHGKQISAIQGAKTPGAIMFVSSGGHVEISVGDGKHMVGAHNTKAGVNVKTWGSAEAIAGYFTQAYLLPNLQYSVGSGGTYNPGDPSGDGGGDTGGAEQIPIERSQDQPWYNSSDPYDKLFGNNPWTPVVDQTEQAYSSTFTGIRALLNDQPLLPYLKNLFNSTMRSFSSAPNGDLIGWFPDYYGIWGTAASMVVEPIEIRDFNVEWSDDFFVTHQYTVASASTNAIDLASGLSSPQNVLPAAMTLGIATIDVPSILYALFGIEATKESAEKFINFIYKRFGARPDFQQLPGVVGTKGEFFSALFLFMRQWAYQYNADIPLTFMPELWPGMLIKVPAFDFQAYVTTVTHSFSFGKDGGFSTSVNIAAPARLPKSLNDRSHALIGLPVAGGLTPVPKPKK